MSSRVQGVIVSHGKLANALLDAVECIVGPEKNLVTVSNEGCGAQLLEERIGAVVCDGPTILFVDMPGGSCFMAAAKIQRTRDELLVLAGVNLPMLLEFVHHLEEDIEALADRLLKSGTNSIRMFP